MDYYNDIPNYNNYNIDNVLAGSIIGWVVTFLGIILLISTAFIIFSIIYNWKIYKKAGKHGWEAIIPIYNLIVKFEFLNIPTWFLFLIIIPAANVALPIIIGINMAKKFGKDGGFAVGLILLPIVFYPVLAFGNAEYHPENKGIFDDVESSTSTNSKYCTNCGTKVVGNYCTNCGKSIEK